MKKNVHNVDGFVAFGGKSPKVINLITREIIPIMRTLEHPIDVAMSSAKMMPPRSSRRLITMRLLAN